MMLDSGTGVLDLYHISADTSKCFFDAGYCTVVPQHHTCVINMNRVHTTLYLSVLEYNTTKASTK